MIMTLNELKTVIILNAGENVGNGHSDVQRFLLFHWGK